VRYALRSKLNRVRGTRQRQASARRIAGLGFWEWTVDSDKLDWSEDAANLLGLDGELPATLAALLPLVHTGDRLRVRQSFAALGFAAGKMDIEFRLPDKSGTSERIITMTGERADESEPGQPVRVFGAFQNVTDSRRTRAWWTTWRCTTNSRAWPTAHVCGRCAGAWKARPGHDVVMVCWIDLARFHRVTPRAKPLAMPCWCRSPSTSSPCRGYIALARGRYGIARPCAAPMRRTPRTNSNACCWRWTTRFPCTGKKFLCRCVRAWRWGRCTGAKPNNC
jgi:hypothetical protein